MSSALPIGVHMSTACRLMQHQPLEPEPLLCPAVHQAATCCSMLPGAWHTQAPCLSHATCSPICCVRKSPASALQVIMYDEPTAGLDPVASTVVEDLIRSLHRPPKASHPAAVSPSSSSSSSGSDDPVANSGVASYIVVTHQHSTIRRSVDRLIFLHEVRSFPRSRWVNQVHELHHCGGRSQ